MACFMQNAPLEALDGPGSLLDFVCRVGSAGLAALQKQWEGRAKNQIELSILRLASKPLDETHSGLRSVPNSHP
jgi:hypothetical protein